MEFVGDEAIMDDGTVYKRSQLFITKDGVTCITSDPKHFNEVRYGAYKTIFGDWMGPPTARQEKEVVTEFNSYVCFNKQSHWTDGEPSEKMNVVTLDGRFTVEDLEKIIEVFKTREW